MGLRAGLGLLLQLREVPLVARAVGQVEAGRQLHRPPGSTKGVVQVASDVVEWLT